MDSPSSHSFIHAIIEDDNRTGKHGGRVVTRFPPEPNGYLHVGHAKSICLNFGLAKHFGGRCHLRFDDTNPLAEDIEYENSMREDVRWLGFDWLPHEYFASGYYEQLFDYACELIRLGKAYVCSLSAEEVSAQRGTFEKPGTNSPDRDRPIDENLDLFRRMRAGEFPDGAYSVRAKIDMASPNPTLRDPAIYRIRHASHHRTGDAWCIYPLYDFAHALSDAIEGITHSICTLEFEVHRPLYDWCIDTLKPPYRPQQIEFARLKLSYTVMSKRKLLQLVNEGLVSGWDDPRMPTIRGMRRRGFTAAAMRAFADRIGVSRADSTIDVEVLEQCVREDLNERAPRAMAVLDPLEVEIENWPEGQFDEVDLPNHPLRPELGTRKVAFGRRIVIEREDFLEDPAKKFFRLAPGREVRLRGAFLITCTGVEKDADGRITRLRCQADLASRGGNAPDGRKVKGTIHWVSMDSGARCTVRLIDRLFKDPTPDEGDWKGALNPDSIRVIEGAWIEPELARASPESHWQFERVGYFTVDPKDSRPGAPVFHRAVALKDSWSKEKDQG